MAQWFAAFSAEIYIGFVIGGKAAVGANKFFRGGKHFTLTFGDGVHFAPRFLRRDYILHFD